MQTTRIVPTKIFKTVYLYLHNINFLKICIFIIIVYTYSLDFAKNF